MVLHVSATVHPGVILSYEDEALKMPPNAPASLFCLCFIVMSCFFFGLIIILKQNVAEFFNKSINKKLSVKNNNNNKWKKYGGNKCDVMTV